MNEKKNEMRGFPITLNIYADNEAEVADARAALVEFIAQHAREGRAVSAKKIAKAVRSWQNDPLVRYRIIKYFES